MPLQTRTPPQLLSSCLGLTRPPRTICSIASRLIIYTTSLLSELLPFRHTPRGRNFWVATTETWLLLQRPTCEFAIEAVQENAEALRYAADSFQNDRDFVKDAVRAKAEALHYAAERFQSSRSFVLALRCWELSVRQDLCH